MPSTRRSLLLSTLLLIPLALAGCAENTGTPGGDPDDGGDDPPAADGTCTSKVDETKSAATPVVTLSTSMGSIRLTMFCDKTPITSQNFIDLAESGYYDGTKFHRVIKDFMNQGGDPKTKDDSLANEWGTGGAAFGGGRLVDEFYCADGSVSTNHPARCPGELGLKHEKAGLMSMANTGQPQTGGSQFFLTAAPTPWLDGKHAIFGEVADQESLDVALAINRVPTDNRDRPVEPVVLQTATVDWE